MRSNVLQSRIIIMKILIATAALAAMFTSPAFAQANANPVSIGHYEWQISPQQRSGPRAPLLAPVKVWVGPEMAAKAPHKTDRAMKHRCADHIAKSGDHNQNS
jgi:hypothetical protein